MTHSVKYLIGDTREQIATIGDGTVSLVACSPPFIALRSYLPADHPDKNKEIGSEPDPATFLDTLLQLTAEWGRVLAPWGSIAIELGDTYAASGSGANTDRYRGYSGGAYGMDTGSSDGGGIRAGGGANWPRPKCLALVPQLYAASLAYGRNLLTGQPSPAGQWLVRNMIVWHRPNPAVGALGDKYRPSTSYITVATRSPKRWFDLTAVRHAHTDPNPDRFIGKQDKRDIARVAANLSSDNGKTSGGNPAGAPPLDTWTDHHDTWTITTQPSRVSIPIESRVPCGPHDGGERTTSPDCPVHGDRSVPAPTAPHDGHEVSPSPHTPRTDRDRDGVPLLAAEHDGATSSHYLDDSSAIPHNTASSRTGHAPSTNQPGTPSAETAAHIERTSESPESSACRPGTSESNSDAAYPPAAELGTGSNTTHMSDQSSACTCTFHLVKSIVHSHYAMWPAKLAERLVLSMCPLEVCATCGEPRRRIEGKTPEYEAFRASMSESSDPGAWGESVGNRAAGFAGTTSNSAARGLKYITEGWTDCGHNNYQPGVTLDPFAGTGTTLATAEYHGRNAIGIDIDSRNHELWPLRRDEVFKALNPTHVKPIEGQGALFG